MPMLKIGVSTYNDKKTPVYLAQGNATRDAENKPVNGKDHAVVGIAAAEDARGNTIYVNLNGWRNQFGEVMGVRKGDSVLVIGRFKKREYNGKDYYDLDVDFICKTGAGIGDAVTYSAPPPDMGDLPDFGGGAPAGDFSEIEEDGELPF
ncbi:MAG: hypothetical protein IJU66_00040 [Oscillospiraceae bacterium]|nr:hypothetical protein [Oscillospiraceae bacterium]